MLRPLAATVWHMGALHPYEQALTLLLAFGPFVVLGVVLWLRRREDDREAGPEVGREVGREVGEEDPAAPNSPSRTAPPEG